MLTKKFFAIAVFCLLAPAAFAEKIGVLNPQAAIMGSDIAKKAMRDLEENKEYAALVAKAENLRADLQSLAKEAETKGMTWSVDERAAHQKKIEYVNADFQLAGQKIQAERKAMSDKVVREVQPKLEKVIEEVVKKDKLDVVLNAQAVFFASEKVDITKKVVEALNKK